MPRGLCLLPPLNDYSLVKSSPISPDFLDTRNPLCNNQNSTLTHSTDFFFFVVPDICHIITLTCFDGLISRRTAHAPQHRRLLLYFHIHIIYGRDYRYLAIWLVNAACSKIFPLMLSHHPLAVRAERYGKIGTYIGAMGDVVIFLYRRYARGEGRREQRREGARD
jgi:hypothetical protein